MIKRTVLLSLFVATAAFGAMSNIAVTVSDSAGKVSYKGHLKADGSFATGKLGGGNYVVQFNTDGAPAGGNYALILSAGKEKVSSESVAGTRFTKGGVAMKIKVGDGLNVTGQVMSGKAAETMTGGPGSKMKIVNGKRWFLVKGSTGSNLGEHWVEEGSPEARNLQGLSNSAVGRMQERGAPAQVEGR